MISLIIGLTHFQTALLAIAVSMAMLVVPGLVIWALLSLWSKWFTPKHDQKTYL